MTTYAHDPAGQLTQILHRKTADNTALAWANYAYDPAGNRTSMTDYTGTHAYAYDDLHRLISASHPTGSAVPTKHEVFDYDRAGNRLFDANITGYQYDAANRLLENSSFTYAYDNNGNQTGKTLLASGQTTAYAYNAENQLVQADMPDGTRQMNAYDGLGRRIEKSTGPVGNMTTVRYVYDNEDILAMLDGSNNLIALFTHGPGIDEPNIMKEAGGPEYFFHADALGSIVGLTDAAGELVERIEYEAYGTPRFIDLRGGTPVAGDRSFTASPYGFQGREWDSLQSLYFFRMRYYDPRRAQFISADPLLGFADRFNAYVAFMNNPAKFSDPTGLAPISGGEGGCPYGDSHGGFHEGLQEQMMAAGNTTFWFKESMMPLLVPGMFIGGGVGFLGMGGYAVAQGIALGGAVAIGGGLFAGGVLVGAGIGGIVIGMDMVADQINKNTGSNLPNLPMDSWPVIPHGSGSPSSRRLGH